MCKIRNFEKEGREFSDKDSSAAGVDGAPVAAAKSESRSLDPVDVVDGVDRMSAMEVDDDAAPEVEEDGVELSGSFS